MKPHEKWIELLRSIRKAAKILNMDLTEEDMPDGQNWFMASKMNKRLWDLVRLKKQEA